MSSVTLTTPAVCNIVQPRADGPTPVQDASPDKFEGLKPALRERMQRSVADHHKAIEVMMRASDQAKTLRQADIKALVDGLVDLERTGLADGIVSVWTEASVARNGPVTHQTLFVGDRASCINLYESGKFFISNEMGDFRITDPLALDCSENVFGPFLDAYKTPDAALEHIVEDLEWGMDWETAQLDTKLHPENSHPAPTRPGITPAQPAVVTEAYCTYYDENSAAPSKY